MVENDLHLRTVKCVEDVANKVTLLMWGRLVRGKSGYHPDAHRFPAMSRAVKEVLQRQVGICPVYDDPSYCDVQGGPRSAPQDSAPCQEHAQRLQEKCGKALANLASELRRETVDFLSRHDPKRARFQSLADEDAGLAVEAAMSYLKEALACSCCERGETT